MEFAEAAASSLELLIIASFGGGAAEHYFALRRLLQRAVVDACNRHDWVIPFRQITSHQASGSG